MNERIKSLEERLQPLRKELKNHVLYSQLASVEDIRVFMEQHVFAVWDFMSLLKELQVQITCVRIPWIPKKNGKLVRFINEITLDEESDFDNEGVVKSHFEMYLDAMKAAGASTNQVEVFLRKVESALPLEMALESVNATSYVSDFVNFTFSIVNTKEAHKIAAAFTFGREDVIPDMFLSIISNASKEENMRFDKFRYYLQRHIELDGDDHGPLALQMIEELCGNDTQKWKEVTEVAENALQQRIALWSGIHESIVSHKNIVKNT